MSDTTERRILQQTYRLANGVEVPKLGLGTWRMNGDEAERAVQEALRIGYRHIDTAQAYQNEGGVGRGLRASGVARDEVFVTSKVAAELKSYDEAAASIDASREALGLDVLDLMLIHSPQPWRAFGGEDRFFEGNREAWRALEDAHRAGKLRAIGVSNFDRQDLDNILAACSVRPMVDQVLAHIGRTPEELIRYARREGILVEAYSPIAHGALLQHEVVSEMAERYGVSVARLSIRYTLQLGLLPLPKTANPAHMEDNAAVDFEIADDDMERLRTLPPLEDYGQAGRFPVFAAPRG